MNSIEKRKATILKKRENKLIRQQIYKNKQELKGDIKYSEFQLKYVNDNKKPLMKKVLCLIKNADIKHATQLKIKYKNTDNSVIQIRVEKYNLTKQLILKDVETIRQYYIKKKINAKFEIVLLYNDGWKSGKVTNMNDELNIYDPISYYRVQLNNNVQEQEQEQEQEQTKFNKYDIFIIEEPNNVNLVGTSYDSLNNCLYECLKEMIPKDKLFFESAITFKRFLNVKSCDKVDIIQAIPIIEKEFKYKYQINVFCDVSYISCVKSHNVINLQVNNNHVIIKHNNLNLSVKHKTSYEEKIILLYNQKTFYAYDEVNKYFISKQLLTDIYKHKTQYIIIFKGNNKISFEEEYKNINIIANDLKKYSYNKLNLRKTGNYKNTALHIFNSYNKTIYTEHINQHEANIINNSSCGAIIFCKQYIGPAYEFDIISMYPSILISNLLIPLQQGEFNIISNNEFQEKEYYAYGLYHCIINKDNLKVINNLFRFNDKNWYTHIDIKRAKELKLSVMIIENNECNFIYYNSSKCIKACDLFKNYVDVLYKLKDKKIEGSKMILNMLWGVLCEKKKTKHYIDINENFIIPDNNEISHIKHIDNNKIILHLSHNHNIYKTDYARMCSFLLSQARYNISKIIEPYKNDVINCHTDGFTLQYHPKELKTGLNIGELKYNGYCRNYHIKNCNNKNGDFSI